MVKIDDLTVQSFLKLLTQEQKDRVFEILNEKHKTMTVVSVRTRYNGHDTSILAQYKYSTYEDLAQQIINDKDNYEQDGIGSIFCNNCANTDKKNLCKCCNDCNLLNWECECKCDCEEYKVNLDGMNRPNKKYENKYYGYERILAYNQDLHHRWKYYTFENERTTNHIKVLLDDKMDFDTVPNYISKNLLDSIYGEVGYEKLIDDLLSSTGYCPSQYNDVQYCIITLNDKDFYSTFGNFDGHEFIVNTNSTKN